MNRPKHYQQHGVHTLKRAVRTLGARALPGRSTALGRALHEWRTSLVADLGGEEAISTQQRALIEMAVRTKLLVDSVDAYVLAMPSPVNRQKHCLFAVVRERQALVGQLQSILRDLGLERRAKPTMDLQTYLAAKAQERATAAQPSAEASAGPGAGAEGQRREVTARRPLPPCPLGILLGGAESRSRAAAGSRHS